MSEESNPLSGSAGETERIVTSLPSSETSVKPPAITPSPLKAAQVLFQNAAQGTLLWRAFIAPAWFFFGILVGIGLVVVYAQFLGPLARALVSQPLDAAMVKQAAREGFFEAIRELQTQSSGNTSQDPQPVDKHAFAVREANGLGNQDAKVSIVEFADYQCPFCGRHHQLVSPMIVAGYVKTGKANFLYKHLAFLGPESVYAAVASECAADQGKFWEYHDYLFTHQNGENRGAFNKDKLIGFGQELHLDMARFEKCVLGEETVARVQADRVEAQKFGVTSTPTFFVNGKPLVGFQSPDEFEQAIEQALRQ